MRTGAVLWVAAALITVTTDALSVIDLYVMLGATVVVPRSTVLLGWRLPPSSVTLAGWGGLAAGLTWAPGAVAGVMTLPWVVSVAWIALAGLWPLGAPRRLEEALPVTAGVWAMVGAVSAAFSAFGISAFGIAEPIVRLTAVHYLVAGMGATTLGWRISRGSGTPGRIGACLTAATPPVIAAGFVTSHPIPQVGGAVLLTMGVYLVAAAGVLQIPGLKGTFARLLQASSSGAVVAAMMLAVAWAAAQYAQIPSLSIPDMAKVHGTLNGVGFIACGLTAWLLHDGHLHLPTIRPLGRTGHHLSSLAAILILFTGACTDRPVDLTVTNPSGSTTTSICAHIPKDQGGCGPTFEEQRNLNLRYADRLDFTGDLDKAHEIANQVRAALEQIAAAHPSATPEQVRAALHAWEPDVEVTDKAVRMAGTAFAVAVGGGCVFGSVYGGEPKVSVGGYISDGGCLATYAH